MKVPQERKLNYYASLTAKQLGSIDLTAAARSVLLIGRVKENENMRAVAQVKNNLAAEGKPIVFELAEGGKFNWVEDYELTKEELFEEPCEYGEKLELAIKYIQAQIRNGNNTSDEIYKHCTNLGISRRTIEAAKRMLGVTSKRRQQKWYWELPTVDGGAND
jgi:hypothetical protein